MTEQMTKDLLISTLQTRRTAWEALLAEVPHSRMTEPGVAGIWSVKDIITHLTYYERWIADRLHEQLRGEHYHPTEFDRMEVDQLNDYIYQQHREQPLDEVLADSQQAFARLLAGVQVHSEAFLIEPQQFEGAPGPMALWQLIRGNVYDHYGLHAPDIRNWLEARG